MVSTTKQLFFIALLPPNEVQQFANRIKRHFAEVYQSRAALKSPPHITLQPPFPWLPEDLPILEKRLAQFTLDKSSIPIILDGFAAFKPRVIYINVIKTPELLLVQKELLAGLESFLKIVDRASQNRSFTPHLTVGFRDLSEANFDLAWQEFAEQKLIFEFTVSQLTLLAHNGKFWQIQREFAFGE